MLFDVNRRGVAAQLFTPATVSVRADLLGGNVQPFDLTVLSAVDDESREVMEFRRAAGSADGAATIAPAAAPEPVP